MHVPTGRPVKLTLASEDVIHSFYIPAFRLKHDVVPGSYQTYWFEATKPGRYHIFCAEYCGTNHSDMGGWVTVMEPSDYRELARRRHAADPWRIRAKSYFSSTAASPATSPIARAAARHCATCSAIRCVLDDGRTVLADEAYVRESILNPNAKIVKGYKRDIMPVFQGPDRRRRPAATDRLHQESVAAHAAPCQAPQRSAAKRSPNEYHAPASHQPRRAPII